MIAGTIPYLAPEQTGRMNRSVDSRSDLYALGVTFYEMLAGNLPFTAASHGVAPLPHRAAARITQRATERDSRFAVGDCNEVALQIRG
jgi:serine/threonine protein kinase